MSRAREIADEILASERFANTRAFADRVYRDEPILRTGADVARDMQAVQAARSERVVRRAAPRERAPLPTRYKKMRQLARKNYSWGYTYRGGGAQLFYEQGKLMEGFEDDFAGSGDFYQPYPSYNEMSDYELRCYFGWRTRLRSGETPEAPVSFLFVHAYELLCGIGVEPGEQGYAELRRLAEAYAGVSDSFDARLVRWTHDYVLFHGLDVGLLPQEGRSFAVESVAVLRRAQQALLGDAKGAGGPSDEELLDACMRLSRYRADRSRFLRDHRADAASVVAGVFARMVDHCHRRRKTEYVEGLFGMPTRLSYILFPSALFWSPEPHEDVAIRVSDAESYVCERGFWWRELPCRRTETSKELGALMHAIDARMRVAFADAHPLKARPLPKYQAKFVDEEIAALVARREAEEAARIVIDRRALGEIRSAAVRTREALLTDEEREEEETPPVAEPVRDEAPSVAPVLDEHQLALLSAILEGTALPGDALFVSLAADAINEAFLDVVGDTVIEFSGDVPTLVEDYADDVRSTLADWGLFRICQFDGRFGTGPNTPISG